MSFRLFGLDENVQALLRLSRGMGMAMGMAMVMVTVMMSNRDKR
jgi:hypothetical protein